MSVNNDFQLTLPNLNDTETGDKTPTALNNFIQSSNDGILSQVMYADDPMPATTTKTGPTDKDANQIAMNDIDGNGNVMDIINNNANLRPSTKDPNVNPANSTPKQALDTVSVTRHPADSTATITLASTENAVDAKADAITSAHNPNNNTALHYQTGDDSKAPTYDSNPINNATPRQTLHDGQIIHGRDDDDYAFLDEDSPELDISDINTNIKPIQMSTHTSPKHISNMGGSNATHSQPQTSGINTNQNDVEIKDENSHCDVELIAFGKSNFDLNIDYIVNGVSTKLSAFQANEIFDVLGVTAADSSAITEIKVEAGVEANSQRQRPTIKDRYKINQANYKNYNKKSIRSTFNPMKNRKFKKQKTDDLPKAVPAPARDTTPFERSSNAIKGALINDIIAIHRGNEVNITKNNLILCTETLNYNEDMKMTRRMALETLKVTKSNDYVDHQPNVVPRNYIFSGPGAVDLCSYFGSIHINVVSAIDDRYELIPYLNKDDGYFTRCVGGFGFVPYSITDDINGVMASNEWNLGVLIRNVLSYNGKTMHLKIVQPECTFGDTKLRLNADRSKGKRSEFIDNDYNNRHTIVTKYNRRLRNIFYISATVLRQMSNAWEGWIDLTAVAKALHYPVLDDDEFRFYLREADLDQNIINRMAHYETSIQNQVYDGNLTKQNRAPYFDVHGRIDEMIKNYLISPANIFITPKRDINVLNGNFNGHTLDFTLFKANKLVLTAVPENLIPALSKNITYIISNNTIKMANGRIAVTHSPSVNYFFSFKNNSHFCPGCRIVNPNHGRGIENCPHGILLQKQLDDNTKIKFKNESVVLRNKMVGLVRYRYCNLCGGRREAEHNCPNYRDRIRSIVDGGRSNLVSPKSAYIATIYMSNTNKIMALQSGADINNLSNRILITYNDLDTYKNIYGDFVLNDIYTMGAVSKDDNAVLGIVFDFEKIKININLKRAFLFPGMWYNEAFRFDIYANAMKDTNNSNNNNNNNGNGSFIKASLLSSDIHKRKN